MKALILGVLLLVNSSIINPHTSVKTSKIVSLDVNKTESKITWHAEKPTGTHDGSIDVYWGKLNIRDKRLVGGFILIDMQSIKVTDLTSPDKEKLESNLKGDNFFDAGRFTVARFDITNIIYVCPQNPGKVIIEGNLNMHGVTKKIEFKTGIQKNTGSEFVAVADAEINRRDWNIATGNFKYNTFISPIIKLHIVLEAA